MATTTTRHSTPIRVALLGFGTSGRVFHAPLITADGRFTLTAVVTPSAEHARLARHAYPDAAVLLKAEQVWERAADFDLVVVGTSNASHLELSLAAIDAGLAVVVEKPLALSAREGRMLIDAAARAGVPLTVFLNRRWDGDFQTVKQLVAEGALGKVHQFESRFTWWAPLPAPGWKSQATVAEGGGSLYDLGPHLIDQAIQLFGPVASAYVELDRRRDGAPADDDAFVSLTHANGVRSRLWMSGATPVPGPRFRLVGSQAGFTKPGLDPQEAQLDAGMLPSEEGFGWEPESHWGRLGVEDDTRAVPIARGAYREFYAQLARALNGEGPLPVDPADALGTLELIEQLHEQAAGR